MSFPGIVENKKSGPVATEPFTLSVNLRNSYSSDVQRYEISGDAEFIATEVAVLLCNPLLMGFSLKERKISVTTDKQVEGDAAT